MKKKYFFLVILSCYFISCKPSIDDKRKATMTEIVNAIIKNDTLKVFRLVDTSIIFNTTGKDGFMYNINSLNIAFSKEQIKVNKNDFLPVDFHNGSESYKVTFPLKKSYFDKIDMEFSFDHGVFNFAYSFDASFKRNKVEPLDAAPSGN